MRRRAIAVVTVLLLIGVSAAATEIDETTADCSFSPAEQHVATLLENHAGQRREVLVCDSRLQAFAKSRAKDMAERDYFSHVTPERNGPNELLRETGYEMPGYYVGGIGNSVESILAGEAEPGKAWKLLLDSPAHRKHLLGTEPMYSQQQRYGIAYYHKPESSFAHYWVIVIVENGRSDRPMTCTPPPSVCIVH